MGKTAFTILINGQKYLTIFTTADRIKSKAERMHYRMKNATNIQVANATNQIIYTVSH